MTEPTINPAVPAPHVGIPASSATVKVSIIDTGVRLHLPVSTFIETKVEGFTTLSSPAYSFLVEHPTHGKLLFDLSVRKDWESLAPAIVGMIKAGGWTVDVKKDVVDVLEENGIKAEEIKSVIWSHWHFDHVGDMSRFPSSTELVVGAGFPQAFIPGFPTNPASPILESDYEGRTVREIDFTTHPSRLRLGRFDAIDYFGDGSFYLLNSPGHAIGHINGLARTTPTTFILTGGDTAHHPGVLRPTPYLPLPTTLSPSPLTTPPFLPASTCPGHLLAAAHPKRSATEPFLAIGQLATPDFDRDNTVETVGKMEEFDADGDVFVVIAHDASLEGVVEFFPEEAGGWKERGWKGEGRWRFLADFRGAVEA